RLIDKSSAAKGGPQKVNNGMLLIQGAGSRSMNRSLQTWLVAAMLLVLPPALGLGGQAQAAYDQDVGELVTDQEGWGQVVKHLIRGEPPASARAASWPASPSCGAVTRRNARST